MRLRRSLGEIDPPSWMSNLAPATDPREPGDLPDGPMISLTDCFQADGDAGDRDLVD